MVMLLGAVFLLTTGGTYPGIASVEAHVIGQVLAVVVLGGWLLVALVRPAWRPTTPLLLPVALACAAYGLSALFSQRPRLSFEPTIAGLGWAYAFLLLGRLFADGWFRARAFVLMVAFVAIVSIGYLVQVAIEWVGWWGLIGRFAIPPLRPSFAALWFGSPNLVATALIMLTPLVVAVLWHRERRVFASLLAVTSLLAIFVSGSRGAWLGTAVGVAAAVLLAAIGGGLGGRLQAIAVSIRGRPITLVPIGLAALAIVALIPAVLLRFAQGGGTLRLDLWRSALTIFSEHPLFGAGPGTWVQLKVAANPDGVPNLILPHAHNLYLQAAAEVGVVGVLALAVLVGAVARLLARGMRSASVAEGRGLNIESAAVVAGLAGLAAQSAVDNLVNLPFVCLVVVAVVAWIDGRLTAIDAIGTSDTTSTAPARARTTLVARAPILAVVGGLLVLGASTLILARIDRAASLALEGNAAALRGHWAAALAAYDGARQADAGFTLYEVQTAGALSRLGRTAEARDLLAAAVGADPIATNVIGLAALEAELGNRADAVALVARARELGVGDAFVALNGGLIAERVGEQAIAIDALADAVAIAPPLAGSGLWQSVSTNKDEVIAAARSRVDDLSSALILAYAGDPGAARSALTTLPASDWRDVYLAATDWLEFRPDDAMARLTAMLEADPADWFVAAWAARIARLSDDPSSGAMYERWAMVVAADAARSVVPEFGFVPAGHDAASAGLPGEYPWAVYLRPITPYLMVRPLVLIGTR